MTMPSLLVVVFAVEVAVHIINLIGAAAINNLLWTAFNFLPVPTSKAAAEQRKIQKDYLQVRGELNATSSQDEFAKWAKIRRQHDKLLEKLEAKKKSMEASRSKFDTYLTGVRLVLTRAPQYLIPFWYSKQPMFWLPHGWFPYYAEWIISFPRAPLGSVSVASWQLACTAIITLLSDVLRSIVGVFQTTGAQPTKEKMAMPAKPSKASAKGAKAAKGGEKVDEKKEL